MKTDFKPTQGLQELPAEIYHAQRQYLSSSMLTRFLDSPAHLQAYLRNPMEQTPAMALGSLIHTCVLEPECLDRDYVVSPKFDRRTKDGKAAAEAFATANAGRTAIDAETNDQVIGILRSVYSHDDASAFLRGGVAERCVFWTDEKTGVKCRSRIDYYVEAERTVVDFKSTKDARPKQFQRSVVDFGYWRQLAFYARGLKANGLPVERHILIAAEKEDPYGVMVYELEPDAIMRAEAEIDEALERYAECLKTGLWPAYAAGIQGMGLPSWA